MRSIEVRKSLTDEWGKAGVKSNEEYAFLTDAMTKMWSGFSTKEYKKYKGLIKESLRDNMTNTELVLNMLAEVAATDISKSKKPKDYNEVNKASLDGANTARKARIDIEKQTGKKIVSKLSAKNINELALENDDNEIK